MKQKSCAMVSIGRSSIALLTASFHRFPTRLSSSRRAFLTATTTTSLIFCTTTSSHPYSIAATAADSHLAMSTSNQEQELLTGYLNAVDAAALDAELMSTPGFSLEQLMELAGLACAEAVYQVVPPTTAKKPKVLVVAGPGNNGGDGLVAARHLTFFGYDCAVVYPKRSKGQHFVNLVQQCQDVGVPILDELPTEFLEEGTGAYDVVLDAIFGFSFKGEPREPFASILKAIMAAQASNPELQVISVDVPSGWNVDEGDTTGLGFLPNVLISLTTPKHSSKGFPGRHFVGGRFLPPALAEKYHVRMPPYPGTSQVMEVTSLTTRPTTKGTYTDRSWEADYFAYLAEKEEAQRAAPATPEQPTKGDEATDNEESWELQYAAYCAEKEARLAKEDEAARRRQRETQES